MQNRYYLVVSFMLLAAVGIFDFNISHRICTMIFYLIPIVFAACFCGRFWGIVLAVSSAVIWMVVDLQPREGHIHYFVSFWAAAVRIAFFVAIVFFIEIKSTLKKERAQSRTDGPTGLWNRKYLYEAINNEIERCRRYKHPFTVVFIDCDNFKLFEHQEAQEVLKQVAGEIKKTVRITDMVVRFDDDEFVLLLTETNQESAKEFLNRLRDILITTMRQARLSLTFRFGAVSFLGTPLTAADVIKQTDELMYFVKSEGGGHIEYRTYHRSVNQ